MKKFILTAIIGAIALLVILIGSAYYSFSTIIPTTKAINRDLAQYFSKVVTIPNGIEPPVQTFDQTIYQWEMETPQKEVVGVKLWHNTAFKKGEDTIKLTLEKEEKGDPSIFSKVLPAVVMDKGSLDVAQDSKQSSIDASAEASYKNFKVAERFQNDKATKLEWEFRKDNLPQNIKEEYKKLESLPLPIGFLYALHNYVVDALSSQ
ncbi:MAG TPA: hypothetical protein VLE91_04545 [Candidatus Saccharimonadales bacterium]|nr:hypothetical protein [Candidatus Saccharimonadales bacterium]